MVRPKGFPSALKATFHIHYHSTSASSLVGLIQARRVAVALRYMGVFAKSPSIGPYSWEEEETVALFL